MSLSWLCCPLLVLSCLLITAAEADQCVAADTPSLIAEAACTAQQVRRDCHHVNSADCPIGVFDSGTGGMAVLEAILTIDAFRNATARVVHAGDGQADFATESFIYLADQANMPYGNYPSVGRAAFLEALAVKDAEFLLGNRYFRHADSPPALNKLPVKAIVIACNTATAYGKPHIEKLVEATGLNIPVIGVVDAGARGALDLFNDGQSGTIGVLATRATVLAKAYPRAIEAEIARRRLAEGKLQIGVVQQGSLGMAGAIDGVAEFIVPADKANRPRDDYQGPSFTQPHARIDPAILPRYAFDFSQNRVLFAGTPEQPTVLQLNSVANYLKYDLVSLLETLRQTPDAKPLRAIILGCTHFPYHADLFHEELRRLADYQENGVYIYRDLIASGVKLIDPAYYVGRELYLRLAEASLLDPTLDTRPGQTRGEFYITVPHRGRPQVQLSAAGQFTHEYKYSPDRPQAGADYRAIPLRQEQLDSETAGRLRRQVPVVWEMLDEFHGRNDKAAACESAGATAAVPQTEFHVASNGDDANPGALERPFASLERARDAVRQLKRSQGLPEGGVTVWLRGGELQRSTPLVLSPEDSGEPGKPVRYAAYAGEKPVVFGGRYIKEFQPGPNGVWQATIPEAKDGKWIFRTLYVNGRRYTLARSPNRGYFRMAGGVPDDDSPTSGPYAGKSKGAFRAPPEAIELLTHLDTTNLKVWGRWWTSLYTLASVDPATGIVRLAGPARRPLPTSGEMSPFLVENHPGALDEPGEWQLDRKTGVLRIIPNEADDLGSATVFAPVTERLLVLEGDPDAGRWIEHVELEGIAFRTTDWTLPPEGIDDAQAAASVGAMIEAVGARHCLFNRCEMSQTDSYALSLGRACRDCTVRQCHIHDLGAGGVKIGEKQDEGPELRATTNRVENCFVHNGGHVHGSGIGVWVGVGSDNVVTHNEICDFWYTGVSVGWCWGTRLNGARNNRVTHNHIHHVVQRLQDGAGIYCLGLQPLTALCNNCIHDIGHDGGHPACRGIYLDEGCAGILVEKNVIYDTQGAALRMQVGTSCNIFLNNICAFAREFSIDMEVARTNVFINNIIYFDQGKLFRYDKFANYEKFLSGNVYWRTDGEPILFAGHTWQEWRNQRQTPIGFYKGATMDQNSVIADPRFVDPEGRDFRLKPDSPALTRGFQPIDMDTIGLTGDDVWCNLPSVARIPISRDDITE